MSSPTITSTINKLPVGKTFAHLVRREFVEHRGSYFFTPVILGLLMVGMVLFVLIPFVSFGEEIGNITIDNGFSIVGMGEILEELEDKDLETRETVMSAFMVIIAAPFLVALLFIMVFAVLGSLFDDRIDKSTLFWKSMPVSDTQEVISKLISAIILAPALAIGLAFVFQLAFLIIASLVVFYNGGSAWDIVWAPAPVFAQPLGMFLSLVVVMLWQLPFWGWLTLSSSIAPKAPLLVAAVPLAIIVTLEQIFYQTHRFGSFMLDVIALNFSEIFGDTLNDRLDGYPRDLDVNVLLPSDAIYVFGQSVSMGSFYGMLALGTAFIAGAIYIRKSNVRL